MIYLDRQTDERRTYLLQRWTVYVVRTLIQTFNLGGQNNFCPIPSNRPPLWWALRKDWAKIILEMQSC
jgi:hypothetical protein